MKSKKKISKAFIGFLFAAILMWFLITFSKTYNIALNLPVNYINLPKNKQLLNVKTKTINLSVSATGFKLLKLKYAANAVNLNANSVIKKRQQTYVLTTKFLKQTIEQQLLSGVKLQQINTDSLFLDLSTLATKKLAVKPNITLNFTIGYGLQEPLKVVPDSITVSGPESILKDLNILPLEPLTLSNITTNFKQDVLINQQENSKHLNYSHTNVSVSGLVTKFTEGRIKVPFRVLNLPENTQLNTLSKEVEVVFVVGLDDFNTITNTTFNITCDYLLSKTNNLTYLVPKLTNLPKTVKSYKIEPNKIDFIILE